jgi:hypothetical protein
MKMINKGLVIWNIVLSVVLVLTAVAASFLWVEVRENQATLRHHAESSGDMYLNMCENRLIALENRELLTELTK